MRYRWASWLLAMIIAVCAWMGVCSGAKLTEAMLEYRSAAREYQLLQANLFQEEKQNEDEKKLKTINPNYVAWIRIEGTKIDYPVVQQVNQSPNYIETGFFGTPNIAGALFTKNTFPFLDKNTIIFGHNMRDGSMFSGLKKYLESGYIENHPIIMIRVNGGMRDYKIFSVQLIPKADDRAYVVEFSGDQYEKFLADMVSNSIIASDGAPALDDQILTLSTCYGTDRLLIVQGYWEGGVKHGQE